MRGKLWVSIAVSVVLLWLAFRGVDGGEIVQRLRQVRTGWLVPVVVSIFLRFWLTAVRWQVLLQPVKPIGLHRLFGVILIGFMANNVLPARIGEFVRAYALGRAESLAAPLAFATIVVERVFDGFTLLLFLVGGLSFLHPDPRLVLSAVLTCALYVGVLGALLALRGERGATRVAWLVSRLPARLGRSAGHLADSFRLGLDVLGDRRALAWTALISLLIWAVNAAGVQATFAAFSLDLPPYAAFLVLAIIAVALVAPAAPGYVGTFQLGTVAGLALFGVPKDTALSLSLVYHVVNYVPITLVGLAYLGALNLSLGELRTASQSAP
jgi:glycosyltransferase 2 family protein